MSKSKSIFQEVSKTIGNHHDKDMEVIDTKYYKGLFFQRIKDEYTPNIYTIRVRQNEVGVTSVLMQCLEITYEEDIHELYISYFFLIKRHLDSLKSNLTL